MQIVSTRRIVLSKLELEAELDRLVMAAAAFRGTKVKPVHVEKLQRPDVEGVNWDVVEIETGDAGDLVLRAVDTARRRLNLE